jgi:hypothetical protein
MVLRCVELIAPSDLPMINLRNVLHEWGNNITNFWNQVTGDVGVSEIQPSQ